MARGREWAGAGGRRDRVSCASVTGISWDFQRLSRNSLQRGLVAGSARHQLRSSGSCFALGNW